MSTELKTQVAVAFTDLERMAQAIAKSGLFGIKSPDQAIALMLIAQAEGKHPALIARDYDIIQGRPAKKSEAMLRDFIQAGGSVKWIKLDDTIAEAVFSHPQGGEVNISWDMKRAATAGLAGRDGYKKYPRQMLRNRVISEGVRTVCPMATSGMYVPEEVQDFADVKQVTPAPSATTFAPKQVGQQNAKPWEVKLAEAFDASRDDAAFEAAFEKLPFETEHPLAPFIIPGGPHAGIKLNEKPDAFWGAYLVELKQVLHKIPDDKLASATSTVNAIEKYLDRA